MRFSDYWARDSFFAVLGVLEIGDFKVARNILELFLDNQKSNGQIARKFELDYNFLKYIFKKTASRKKPKAVYTSLLPPFNTMDGNSLCVIAFAKYLQKTKDIKFARKYFRKLEKTIVWYEKKKRDTLVREYLLSNWMDTIFKSGKVLYSNTLYAKALEEFSHIAEEVGENKQAKKYKNLHKKTVAVIDKKFWNSEFFDDVADQGKYFDSAGNALACFFGIAPDKKRGNILKYFRKIKTQKLLPTVYPKYSFWKVNPITFLFGMSEYHNGKSWLWIDAFVAGAEFRSGDYGSARKRMTEISQVIVANAAVHEVFHADGRPYNPKFWKSAVPFAWNSGVFLYINSLIK